MNEYPINEQGVVSPSVKYVIEPTEFTKKHLNYVTECGKFYCRSSYYKKRLSTPGFLICVVHRGDFFLYYRNSYHFLGKGEAFLIDMLEPHYYHAGENLHFDFLLFHGNSIKNLAHHIMQDKNLIFSGETVKNIDILIKKSINHIATHNNPHNLFLSLNLYEILLSLINKETKIEIDENASIDKAIKYIRTHYHEPLTLDEIANYIGLSKYHFIRQFKDKTGYTPIEYLISTRLDIAKFLLINSEDNVEEIAYKVGYSNPKSFTNTFKKQIHMSPSKYRKLAQKNLE